MPPGLEMQGRTCKGPAASSQLPQQDAIGVDVTRLAALAMHQQLRRHVSDGPLSETVGQCRTAAAAAEEE